MKNPFTDNNSYLLVCALTFFSYVL